MPLRDGLRGAERRADEALQRPRCLGVMTALGQVPALGQQKRGLGRLGRIETSGWGFRYDVYGGAIPFDIDEPYPAYAPGLAEESALVTNMLGARLVLVTSVEGLTVGAKFYVGQEVGEDDEANAGETRQPFSNVTFGVDVQYEGYGVTLRTEYLHHRDEEEYRSHSLFAEVAYRFTEHWQVGARFDLFAASFLELDTSAAPSLLDHKEAAVTVNYWFSASLVFKLQYSFISGNRFAHPEGDQLVDAIASNALPLTTHYGSLGLSFGF